MKRWWPLALGIPLVAGLALLRFSPTPQEASKKPETASRVISGVTVKRPDPRVVVMPETPKDVADPVNRTRVRDLVNQAVAAGVRGDKTTRSALVSALRKDTQSKVEIDSMLAQAGGAEAVQLTALAREVAR